MVKLIQSQCISTTSLNFSDRNTVTKFVKITHERQLIFEQFLHSYQDENQVITLFDISSKSVKK